MVHWLASVLVPALTLQSSAALDPLSFGELADIVVQC